MGQAQLLFGLQGLQQSCDMSPVGCNLLGAIAVGHLLHQHTSGQLLIGADFYLGWQLFRLIKIMLQTAAKIGLHPWAQCPDSARRPQVQW